MEACLFARGGRGVSSDSKGMRGVRRHSKETRLHRWPVAAEELHLLLGRVPAGQQRREGPRRLDLPHRLKVVQEERCPSLAARRSPLPPLYRL